MQFYYISTYRETFFAETASLLSHSTGVSYICYLRIETTHTLSTGGLKLYLKRGTETLLNLQRTFQTNSSEHRTKPPFTSL